MIKKKCHHSPKRHYKHLAAALFGATIMSAAFAPAMPAVIHQPPAAKPLNASVAQAPPTETDPLAPFEATDAKQVLDITATAYAPGSQDNGRWGSKTHLGTQVRPGVIAVDPRIILLGSWVLIKYPDGHTEHAVAEDTGSAIKGHRIDVAKWTRSEALSFGIKPVRVYVLRSGPVTEENQV